MMPPYRTSIVRMRPRIGYLGNALPTCPARGPPSNQVLKIRQRYREACVGQRQRQYDARGRRN
jgi:hypothetical protein